MNNPIDKLKNGNLSAEEFEVLKKLFNSSSDEELAALFPETQSNNGDIDVDGMLQHIKTGIDMEIKTQRQGERIKRFKIIAIAATILSVVLMSGIAYIWIGNKTDAQDSIALYSDKNGSITADLSDGTRVIMKNGSEIILSDNFSPRHRKVSFRGEAYFNVAKDGKHPFTIRTCNMEVNVRGTSFNLFADDNAKYSELSLDKGVVNITSTKTSETITLSAGECALLNNTTGEISISHPGRDSSNWQNNELYFDHADARYVVDRINKTYDANLDTLMVNSMTEKFTGVLPADNLEEALCILENLYNIKIRR